MTVEQAKALIEAKKQNPKDPNISFQKLQQATQVLASQGLKAR